MSSLSIEKLAAIAFFALVADHRNTTNFLFSYETSKNFTFSVSSEGSVIGIFDYQRGSYLTGNPTTGGWGVFDYADGDFVDFNRKNGKFSAFDYLSSSFIDIEVKGDSVELFSYETGEYYTFGLL